MTCCAFNTVELIVFVIWTFLANMTQTLTSLSNEEGTVIEQEIVTGQWIRSLSVTMETIPEEVEEEEEVIIIVDDDSTNDNSPAECICIQIELLLIIYAITSLC